MKIRKLLKGAIKLCLSSLLLYTTNANAQLSFRYDTSQSAIYFFEKKGHSLKCLDTMRGVLDMFTYSFMLKERRFYDSYVQYGWGHRSYVIDSWVIDDSGILAHTPQVFISMNDNPKFIERKLNITLSEGGVCMTFEKGDITMIELSYSIFESQKKVDKTIKKIVKMLKG